MLAATLALAAVLSATPHQASVLCPGFSAEGLSEQAAGALVDRFASELGKAPRLKVVTNRDVGQLLGLERQKQLLGCSAEDSGSCLAELAGAVGADFLVTGSVVKVGSRFTVTVRVLRLPGGEPMTSDSKRVDGEDALSDWLDELAAVLPARLLPGAPGGVTASAPPVPAAAWAPWLVMGAGVAIAATGGVLYGLSRGDVDTLKNATPQTDIAATVAAGRTREALGAGLLTAGGVAVAAGLTWRLLARPADGLALSVGPTRVSVSVTFP